MEFILLGEAGIYCPFFQPLYVLSLLLFFFVILLRLNRTVLNCVSWFTMDSGIINYTILLIDDYFKFFGIVDFFGENYS